MLEKNKVELKTYRRKLRNSLSPAEAKLWTFLKNRKFLNLKFRRQFSLGNYILDFYCPEYKLNIELDGDIHSNPIIGEKDFFRDQELTKEGISVLRFENKVVFENLEYLLKEIERVVSSTTPILPSRNRDGNISPP